MSKEKFLRESGSKNDPTETKKAVFLVLILQVGVVDPMN